MSFPVDATLAEALIVETLGLDQPLAPVDHRSELDIAALWALAAMADAHRQAELESLLARTPARQVALNEDSIYLRALDGATLPDPRWLSGILTQIFGPGDVTEARLLAGLDLLARGGLIARGKTGLWSPQPAFVTAFAHLELPLAAAVLAVDRRRDGWIRFSDAGISAQLCRRLGHRTARRGRSADRRSPQFRQRSRREEVGARRHCAGAEAARRAAASAEGGRSAALLQAVRPSRNSCRPLLRQVRSRVDVRSLGWARLSLSQINELHAFWRFMVLASTEKRNVSSTS